MQYLSLCSERNRLYDELERLHSLATRCTPSYSGQTSSSFDNNKLPNIVDKITAQEQLIDKQIDKCTDMLCNITAAINSMPEEQYRSILYKRYVQGKKWDIIAQEMNYSKRDLHRKHKKALRILERMQIHI